MEQAVGCACGPAFAGEPLEAYNASAFRYLLDVERRRAERADRAVLLLLVSLKPGSAATRHLPQSVASGLFEGLWSSIREVDFVGWYREHRVAGAVLTQKSGSPSSEACREIRDRVTGAVAGQLPAHLAARLQVRVLRLHPQRNS